MELRPYTSPIAPDQRADRARLTAECKRVYDACAQLPQFLSCTVTHGDGLYNLLSGSCLRIAHTNPAALVLLWTPSVPPSDSPRPQHIILDSQVQLDRFLSVMQAQAAAVDLRTGRAAEQVRAVPVTPAP